MSVDVFFPNTPEGPSHPRLRAWKQRIEVEKQEASIELHRALATIGLSRVRMYVHFYANGEIQATDEADWEQVLNEGLILLKVRAIDRRNEIDRFTMGLRDGFQQIEKEYGNGYFNSVLLDLIDESDLNKLQEIDDVLKYIYHDRTEKSTKTHDMCRDAIALGLGARARELHKNLDYSKEEATLMMTTVLAQYLDERFSVSSRRRFGLL